MFCDNTNNTLQADWTQGEMNDMKGFELYKENLVKLKKIAEEENITINAVVIDAGFAPKKIISWIKDELKVTPIQWPRNPRSGELNWSIHWFNNLRKRLRRLIKLKRDTSPDKLLKDKVYCNIVKAVETIYKELRGSETEYAQYIANLFLEIGVYKWSSIYRCRSTIEGTFRTWKSSYYLLKRTQSQSLPVIGTENIKKHVALLVIAMQINAFYRYLMVQGDTGILKPSLAFTLRKSEVDL